MIWPDEISIEYFREKVKEHHENGEMSPTPIDAQYALDLIYKELIDADGKVPYVTTWPCGAEQVNSVMLDEILHKYSKRYRRFIKKVNKK